MSELRTEIARALGEHSINWDYAETGVYPCTGCSFSHDSPKAWDLHRADAVLAVFSRHLEDTREAREGAAITAGIGGPFEDDDELERAAFMCINADFPAALAASDAELMKGEAT